MKKIVFIAALVALFVSGLMLIESDRSRNIAEITLPATCGPDGCVGTIRIADELSLAVPPRAVLRNGWLVITYETRGERIDGIPHSKSYGRVQAISVPTGGGMRFVADLSSVVTVEIIDRTGTKITLPVERPWSAFAHRPFFFA
ncbi:MAG TPA: hypothetical protein VMT99_04210 [Candidatus Paceibacterota bacterium]|nr:hypothetical protein [Candidatus Paceibacterota bacterium]